MPKSWTAKDERQYEHVKDSERQEGRSPARAKQIAAATVNKHRAAEGRTKTARKSRKTTKSRTAATTRQTARRKSAKR